MKYSDRRFYPLMVNQETEKALTRFCAKTSLSKGKALNELIKAALVNFGYLEGPSDHKHEWTGKSDGFGHWYECVCGARELVGI